MSRTAEYTDSEAATFWAHLFTQKERAPTVKEFAADLEVSTRTAWRYMKRIKCVATCPTCKGRGIVKR